MKNIKTLLLISSLTVLTIFINVDIVKADDISKQANYYLNGEKMAEYIRDYEESSYIQFNENDQIKITSEENITGIYIMYDLKSQTGIIESNDKKIEIGENEFLHEYLEIESTNEFTIKYDGEVKITEIYVLDNKECPDYIEKWEKPLDDNADLLVFSTHFDDETMYLSGPIPTYINKGLNVQLVYYTAHSDNFRYHEMLHGLYKMGVRNYPIIGIMPDANSKSLDEAISDLKKYNLTIDDAVNFQVEMIRRFKPEVIVGHDENGEDGNGQHMLNTHTLKIALEKTNDPNYHLDSYIMYGTWDTPKTYLHLYDKNKITLDLDTPLDHYNGKTAYEIALLGYEQHKSQVNIDMIKWFLGENGEIEKASQIKYYSPTEYGLYRSLVGEDINKNDMFENIAIEVNDNEKDNNNNNYNGKITIPYLYNIITIILVIMAILLYFDLSPAKIYDLFIELKKLVNKEIKSLNKEIKATNKKEGKKTNVKTSSKATKKTIDSKKTNTTKKSANTKKTSAAKKSTTTSKKKTNASSNKNKTKK